MAKSARRASSQPRTRGRNANVSPHQKLWPLRCSAPRACSARASARAAFPDRPITLIVPWAAGGGTDAVARQIAMMLETRPEAAGQRRQPHRRQRRGRPFGDRAGARPTATPSGMITLEINMMHWVGLTDAHLGPVHAVRADEHRRGGDPRASGLAVQDREGAVRAHQGEPEQGRGVGHRGRAAAGISRSPA